MPSAGQKSPGGYRPGPHPRHFQRGKKLWQHLLTCISLFWHSGPWTCLRFSFLSFCPSLAPSPTQPLHALTLIFQDSIASLSCYVFYEHFYPPQTTVSLLTSVLYVQLPPEHFTGWAPRHLSLMLPNPKHSLSPDLLLPPEAQWLRPPAACGSSLSLSRPLASDQLVPESRPTAGPGLLGNSALIEPAPPASCTPPPTQGFFVN